MSSFVPNFWKLLKEMGKVVTLSFFLDVNALIFSSRGGGGGGNMLFCFIVSIWVKHEVKKE